MKKLWWALILALVGFGLTFIEGTAMTVVGVVLMVIAVILLFWGLAQTRSQKKD